MFCLQVSTASMVTTSFLSETLDAPMAISPMRRSSSCCKHSGMLPPIGLPLDGRPSFDLHWFVVQEILLCMIWGSSSQCSRLAATSHLQIFDLCTTPGNLLAHIFERFCLRICRFFLRVFACAICCFLVAPAFRGSVNAFCASSLAFLSSRQYLSTLSFCSMVMTALGLLSGFS